MRVLVLGSFNKGALEHYYCEGLKKHGVELSTFDISADYFGALNKNLINKVLNKMDSSLLCKGINNNLMSFLHGRKFDVILVFKGMFLFPATVLHLKSHCRLLACYNADHPYKILSEGSGSKNILQSIRHFDLYLSYSKNICKGLKDQFGVDAEVLPFGFDDTRTLQAGTGETENNFVFIGAFDRERAQLIDQIKNERLLVFGNDKWRTRTAGFKNVRSRFGGKSLYGDDYSRAISSSLGVLNLMREQNIIEDSHNMRTFEVPGYGGLLISNRTSEQQEFFEEGKEAVYFESIDELSDRLQYLEKNKEKVDAIKFAARQRCIKSGYSYAERARQLIKYFTKYVGAHA